MCSGSQSWAYCMSSLEPRVRVLDGAVNGPFAVVRSRRASWCSPWCNPQAKFLGLRLRGELARVSFGLLRTADYSRRLRRGFGLLDYSRRRGCGLFTSASEGLRTIHVGFGGASDCSSAGLMGILDGESSLAPGAFLLVWCGRGSRFVAERPRHRNRKQVGFLFNRLKSVRRAAAYISLLVLIMDQSQALRRHVGCRISVQSLC